MIDDELLSDFISESQGLVSEMLEHLEEIEGNPAEVRRLEKVGSLIDRIMGGAKSLALDCPPHHALHKVSAMSEICKIVSYKASQISDNEVFYNICVAFLIDASEWLDGIFSEPPGAWSVESSAKAGAQSNLSSTLIDRLKWVNEHFPKDVRASVDFKKGPSTTPSQQLDQSNIDDLLKQLGIG